MSSEHPPARETINRYRDLQERGFGSRVTIWRKVRSGRFPAPEDILDRPGWRETIIQRYLESCSSAEEVKKLERAEAEDRDALESKAESDDFEDEDVDGLSVAVA